MLWRHQNIIFEKIMCHVIKSYQCSLVSGNPTKMGKLDSKTKTIISETVGEWKNKHERHLNMVTGADL